MKNLLLLLIACLHLLSFSAIHAGTGQDRLVARVDGDGFQRAHIVGGEYFFQPRHVVVKANIPVELLLSKEAGMVPHSFAISAPEAGIKIDEELDTEVKKVVFTPTAAGSYPFYCTHKLLFFRSHRDRGMEGVLEVVP